VSDFTIGPNGTVSANLNQSVPEFAPTGEYTYYASVGDHPWVIDCYAAFTFSKEGSAGDGYLGGAEDWLCSGDFFGKETIVDNLPNKFAFIDAYPNPFNPSTTISFQLPVANWVKLEVLDIAGRATHASPLQDGWRDAGIHEVTFDASDLPSGIYLYRLEAGEFSATGKIVLMK
jgi:hypothetical protein